MTENLWLLVLAAFSGTISATAADVDPFLTVEQAILPQTAPDHRRTSVFVIYDLLASFAGAAGALFAGSIGLWGALGLSGASAYKPLFVVSAAIGLLNLVLFNRLSAKVELAKVEGERKFLGIHRSRGTVAKLSLLFSMDSFAGGLTVQSLVAYWFNLRWGLSTESLAVVFFWVNVLSGLSYLGVGPLARRVGLLNTMVFTHLPSSVKHSPRSDDEVAEDLFGPQSTGPHAGVPTLRATDGYDRLPSLQRSASPAETRTRKTCWIACAQMACVCISRTWTLARHW